MCYRKGDTGWDQGLRRVVKIKDVVCGDYGKLYEVETPISEDGCTHHSDEVSCCAMHSLDPKTAIGRRNLKVVAKIEKPLASLR